MTEHAHEAMEERQVNLGSIKILCDEYGEACLWALRNRMIESLDVQLSIRIRADGCVVLTVQTKSFGPDETGEHFYRWCEGFFAGFTEANLWR